MTYRHVENTVGLWTLELLQTLFDDVTLHRWLRHPVVVSGRVVVGRGEGGRMRGKIMQILLVGHVWEDKG